MPFNIYIGAVCRLISILTANVFYPATEYVTILRLGKCDFSLNSDHMFMECVFVLCIVTCVFLVSTK
jgi:hypothetical protein